MEKQINKLFDNFDACLGYYIQDPYVLNSTRIETMRKISEFFNTKNNTEIRNIINLLKKNQEEFYINRNEIFKNVPKVQHPYYGPLDEYASGVIRKSLKTETIGYDAYLFPIELVLDQYRHVYDRNINNIWGYFDTIPKYLGCHIELYENFLREQDKLKREEELKREERLKRENKIKEQHLKRQQKIKEEKLRIEELKREKEKLREEELKREEEEKLREEELKREEEEKLREEENEEKKRLKKEVKRFMENEKCKEGKCIINGGKIIKKTKKNKKNKKTKKIKKLKKQKN